MLPFARATFAPTLSCTRLLSRQVGQGWTKTTGAICRFRQMHTSKAVPPRRKLHSSRALREEKVDPKKVKTQEMLAYEAQQRGEITTARKVVEAGRDASYLVVILAGLGLTGIFVYSLYGELFGGSSPQALYGKALKRVVADDRVRLLIGDNIKGFGEESRRGRRRHVAYVAIRSSQEYEVDGQVYMRMRFHVQGSHGSGTVHLEVQKGMTGTSYRYLFVEVAGAGGASEYVVLEDNR